MELCYRGTTYRVSSTPVNTIESETTARFMGKTYTVRQTSCPVILEPNFYQYRGVIYGKMLLKR